MNDLTIAIDDDEQRGWFNCAYCSRAYRFNYSAVGYSPAGASGDILAASDFLHGSQRIDRVSVAYPLAQPRQADAQTSTG